MVIGTLFDSNNSLLIYFTDYAGQWTNRLISDYQNATVSNLIFNSIIRCKDFDYLVGNQGSMIGFSAPSCLKCTRFWQFGDQDLLGIAADGENMVVVGNRVILVSDPNPALEVNILIDAPFAMEKMNDGALLIDVRTEEEYRKTHIPKCINIPVDVLLNKIETYAPKKEQEIIVYCATGVRSLKAKKLLIQKGYKAVYNLGGINRWPHPLESQ
jgi:rhodanese-related sulfurtransferase